MFNISTFTAGQTVINNNPDRINIDSDDDDDTMTVSDTPTAPMCNDNDFLPLVTTETHPLTTDTSENRKRLHNGNNSERTIVIKRRNASLYQSQDDNDDTDNNSPHVYHDY